MLGCKMSNNDELWQKILDSLEDTLQYGFLEEARYVAGAKVEGQALIISVPPTSAESDKAFQFLSSPSNSQRILILAKRLAAAGTKLDKVQITQEEF